MKQLQFTLLFVIIMLALTQFSQSLRKFRESKDNDIKVALELKNAAPTTALGAKLNK